LAAFLHAEGWKLGACRGCLHGTNSIIITMNRWTGKNFHGNYILNSLGSFEFDVSDFSTTNQTLVRRPAQNVAAPDTVAGPSRALVVMAVAARIPHPQPFLSL
jgi:hypothetical protein